MCQTDARDMSWPMQADGAKKMRDHALRRIVGLDLVGDGKML